ncbi:hypothetical protein ACFSQU_13780 [Massilia sp. GCM10020059]|uniref:Uncharacterized protein n=1 Tax=Massilia agrisoli TaxID=2892444 RepID=A0ABS8IY41_9BURK|nr:hypothetical protein [Massilia agrisoli]MCC6072828.1 hypothetical protein [Massilia agrisoli]
MQGDQVSEQVVEVAEAGTLPLWSPVGIVLWSVLFTPAFGAWLQMYNYRRLGDDAAAAVAWRWCLGGLAVLGWNALASAIGQRLGLDTPLFDWVNGVVFLAWVWATLPGHSRAVGPAYARRGWDSVVVLGLLAAVAYLGASLVLQWMLAELT